MIILPCILCNTFLNLFGKKNWQENLPSSQPSEGRCQKGDITMTSRECLVVPRTYSLRDQQGFIHARGSYFCTHASLTRSSQHLVENDPSLKQIIPYVVLMHAERVFLVKRLPAQSEQRLAGMYSIGIGGHINKDDAADETQAGESDAAESFHSVLVEGMNREIREEVFVGEDPNCRSQD